MCKGKQLQALNINYQGNKQINSNKKAILLDSFLDNKCKQAPYFELTGL